MAKRKSAVFILTGSLLIAGILLFWPVEKGVKVDTAVVGGGQLVQTVMLRGTVQYAQQEPCITLKDGVIADVYAKAGDRVREGELLFRLDTTAEEKALAALYEWEYQFRTGILAIEDAVYALSLQGQLQRASAESELLNGIELSFIRASADGVLEKPLAKAGDYVRVADVLGVIHGDKVQIVVSASANAIRTVSCGNAAAVRTQRDAFPAVLHRMETAQDNSVLLFFELCDEATHDAFSIGEYADVQLCTDITDEEALIPLSAFDRNGNVWYIENGRARYTEPVVISSNDLYAAAEESWSGRVVILYPELGQLREGMPVRGKE